MTSPPRVSAFCKKTKGTVVIPGYGAPGLFWKHLSSHPLLPWRRVPLAHPPPAPVRSASLWCWLLTVLTPGPTGGFIVPCVTLVGLNGISQSSLPCMSPMAAATRETSVGDLEGEREAVAVWQMAPGVAHPLAWGRGQDCNYPVSSWVLLQRHQLLGRACVFRSVTKDLSSSGHVYWRHQAWSWVSVHPHCVPAWPRSPRFTSVV